MLQASGTATEGRSGVLPQRDGGVAGDGPGMVLGATEAVEVAVS